MPMKETDLIPGYYFHIYNRAVEGNLLFRETKNYIFFIIQDKKISGACLRYSVLLSNAKPLSPSSKDTRRKIF